LPRPRRAVPPEGESQRGARVVGSRGPDRGSGGPAGRPLRGAPQPGRGPPRGRAAGRGGGQPAAGGGPGRGGEETAPALRRVPLAGRTAASDAEEPPRGGHAPRAGGSVPAAGRAGRREGDRGAAAVRDLSGAGGILPGAVALRGGGGLAAAGRRR